MLRTLTRAAAVINKAAITKPKDMSEMSEKSVCIIVPAYNEQDNIRSVIESLNAHNPAWMIAVVNDCSTDDTATIVKTYPYATLLDLPINLGIGGGVQTGFKFAARQGYDIAVQFDGDGQHIASEIDALIAPIIDDLADVTIGSRFVHHSESEFRSTAARRVGIRYFAVLNSFLIGQKITDNTSGFRAYNKRAINTLARNYPNDYPEPEAVIMLGRTGYRIKEIPTRMLHRVGGTSSITAVKSVYYMIKVTLAILITSIRNY